MDLNQYIQNNREGRLVKVVKCKSGLTLSVQASDTHYCSPRSNNGPWTEVEVGFPSRKVESIIDWAEDPYDPCNTVYGYVPVAVLEEVIKDNGGLD